MYERERDGGREVEGRGRERERMGEEDGEIQKEEEGEGEDMEGEKESACVQWTDLCPMRMTGGDSSP